MATKSVSVAPPPDPDPEPDEIPIEYPEDSPETVPPLSPSEFDQLAAWEKGYRSMLDAPGHPLGHLKGV